MSLQQISRLTTAAMALTMLCACGSLSSSGQVGDKDVVLDGTGVAWTDLTEYRVQSNRLELVRRSVDNVHLHLQFSEEIFDTDSLTDPLAREAVQDALAYSDLLEIVVSRGDRILIGDELSFDSDEAPNDDGDLPEVIEQNLSLGSADFSEDLEYPDSAIVLADGRRGTLNIIRIDTRVAGTLNLEVFDDAPGSSAAVGFIELGFDVPVLPERVAECAFDPAGAGVVDPCGEL